MRGVRGSALRASPAVGSTLVGAVLLCVACGAESSLPTAAAAPSDESEPAAASVPAPVVDRASDPPAGETADEILARTSATAPPPDAAPVLAPVSDVRALLGREEKRLLVEWRETGAPRVARSLGRIYVQAEDCNRAVEWLAHALRRDPADALAWHWFGVALWFLERPREAVTVLERARDLGHVTAEQFRYEGEALWRLGDHPESVQAFEESLRIDPEGWHANLALASIHEDEGRLERAREYLEALVAIDDEHPTPWFRLARVLRELGEEKRALEAERQHRRAAILDDMRMRSGQHTDVQKHLALGYHLVAQGHVEEALAEYEAALAKSDDPRFREPALAGVEECKELLAGRR